MDIMIQATKIERFVASETSEPWKNSQEFIDNFLSKFPKKIHVHNGKYLNILYPVSIVIWITPKSQYLIRCF